MTKRWRFTVGVLLASALTWVGLPGDHDFPVRPAVRTAEARGRAQVTMYMTVWCRACQRLMRALDREHVPYRAIDIEKEPHRYEPVRERIGRTTIPVTVVRRGADEHWVIGANSREVVSAYRELSD
jgi:glutaredoxin